jgi:hypothetical protein
MDHWYFVWALKMNYVISISLGFNNETGFNYDNAVQLAREQAARIY